MVFLETTAFTRRISTLLTDEEYAELQADLAERPDLGDLIPEGGGLRKLRVAMRGRGKSGGARVIYYWAVSRERILFLRAYTKNEMADLPRKEISRLRQAVEREFG